MSVSIPLEQGSVLRLTCMSLIGIRINCLNPFGTGQCLTTRVLLTLSALLLRSQSLWNRAVSYDNMLNTNQNSSSSVSIPLEQGSVLRPISTSKRAVWRTSQSLWNRAVSYDLMDIGDLYISNWSQSLWNRAVSYDISKIFI